MGDDVDGVAGLMTQKAAPKPTDYVVLQAVYVDSEGLVVSEDASRLPVDDSGRIMLWAPLLNETPAQGSDGKARIVAARSDKEACRIATRMSDDEDLQRPGAYKAIPWRSWKGGVVYHNDQRLVTTAADLED
jgi:hypothetical protein